MNATAFLDGLLEFLSSSPTPFHATSNMAALLEESGFQALDEAKDWKLQPKGRYYVTRNDSSIVAFVVGRKNPLKHGIRMVGAHTDSPCLRVKPTPERKRVGVAQLGVEPYGGVLLNPWFDRDLSMAGRVSYREADGTIASSLVDFKRPVAVIPSLAIHLDRTANDERSINKQLHLPPMLSMEGVKTSDDFRALLLGELKKAKRGIKAKEILEYEISLYDTQPAGLVGLDEDFISSARLDNLLSCWIATTALCDASDEFSSLMVCTDHEEVGSESSSGAQGPFLRTVLERITGNVAEYSRAIDRSVMISADNAHAIHPNFADRHDPDHAPTLNGGPVLKVNNNQRYASNSETASLFKSLCKEARVPMQVMVARSDMGCGTTIGPITATEVGVPTVDVGVPQLAMHSIRETAGSQDPWRMNRVMRKFFSRPTLLKR